MAAQQDTLFDLGTVPTGVGFRGPIAASAAGITYRQIDYWARTGLVVPSVRGASGSGSQRLYGFEDIVALRTVKRLLDAGISLQSVRTAIAFLADQGITDLAGTTLLSDGASVYLATSGEEVLDLLAGGQGVFAIGLSAIAGETAGALADLPSEPAGTPATVASGEAPSGLPEAPRRLRAVS